MHSTGSSIRIAAPLAFSGVALFTSGWSQDETASKINVRNMKVGDLQIQILVHCALPFLVFLVLGTDLYKLLELSIQAMIQALKCRERQ